MEVAIPVVAGRGADRRPVQVPDVDGLTNKQLNAQAFDGS